MNLMSKATATLVAEDARAPRRRVAVQRDAGVAGEMVHGGAII